MIRAEKEDSFFHFFYDPQVTSIGEEEDEEEVYQHIDADFELGLTFKDKVCELRVGCGVDPQGQGVCYV